MFSLSNVLIAASRPLRAVVAGVACANVRLGGRHSGGAYPRDGQGQN